MNAAREPASGQAARRWPVFVVPPISALYMVSVAAIVAAVSAVVVLRTSTDGRDWSLATLLVVMALTFEECARRAGRLRLRLTRGIKRDMTSVWCVAAAVALPPGLAVAQLALVLGYVWFRQQRPAGEMLHRKLFNAATAIAGCLVAGAVVGETVTALAPLPLMLAHTLSVLAALLTYTTVNRLLVTPAAISIGMRGRDLVGSRDDNMIELVTLCLGGLVAVAVTYQPWSALFVLLPMLALQRGALVRELEEAAITDAKTGLLNAVAWEQLAQREISRAGREAQDLTVLIVDIDRFKAVNDRFGHLVGDQVLRGIGRCLAESLRGYDGVGRFGGEEFVAVLPDTGEVSGLEIAERVRARINQLSLIDIVAASARPAMNGVAVSSGADRISVSVGVAVLGVDGPELTDLLYAADQALYAAKRGGRNQVQLARRGGGAVESFESALS